MCVWKHTVLPEIINTLPLRHQFGQSFIARDALQCWLVLDDPERPLVLLGFRCNQWTSVPILLLWALLAVYGPISNLRCETRGEAERWSANLKQTKSQFHSQNRWSGFGITYSPMRLSFKFPHWPLTCTQPKPAQMWLFNIWNEAVMCWQ